MCSSHNRICAPPGARSEAGGCGGAACLDGPACNAWGPGHTGYAEAEPEEDVKVKRTTVKVKA